MLVVEFLDGGSLLSYLQNHFQLLSQAHFLKICLDVFSAMDHLQRLGIVHRDLAARNVLAHSQGSDVICKLSDFGLGKSMHESGYYQADHASPLPFKWSAPEALIQKMDHCFRRLVFCK